MYERKEIFMDGILINDTILVLGAIIAITAFGMYAETKWKWAGLLSGMGVSIFIAVFAVTFHILPTSNAAYDIVFDYVMPLAVPMVLVQANAKRIVKESGRAFLLMNIACVGAVIGGIAMGFVLKNTSYFANDIAGYVAMEVGVCTGGTMNQAAMAKTFDVSSNIVSAAGVGANLVAVLFLVVIGMIPNLKFFRKHFKHPHIDEVEQHVGEIIIAPGEDSDEEGKYSIFGFAKLLTFSFVITGTASVICNLTGRLNLPTVISMLCGNLYLITSLITLAVVTMFPKFAESLTFGMDIGSFMLLMFMTTMGTGGSIIDVIKIAPLIVAGEIIIIFFIMGITLAIAKIFKFNLEEALISINASYGGPATACAYIGTKNWQRLMIPALLIGVYGYIVGNVLGILAGNLFL